MIEAQPASLSFDDMAVNDMPNYRQLKLKNKEAYPVTVSLSASSPFIRFQERNENWNAQKGSENAKESQIAYNELFDSIGLLQSVQLDAGESKDLVVSFQANPAGFAHLTAQSPPTTHGGTIEMMCCSASQASNQTPESPADSIGKKSALTRNKSSFGDVFGASTLSETIVIPFSVNVFVSFLQLSTTELQATMTVKKTQLIDFTVSNLSNRPLPFVIRMQNFPVKGVELELYESEHFEEPKFGRRLYLEAHGSMKMSLMARTASNVTNSQFQATLQCDNLRDRRNTSLIYVNINVVRELQGDIVSLPDTSVNFGDVYRGGKTTAEISLNVLGKEDVGVKLGDAHQWKCEGEVCLMKDKTAVDETTISSGQGKSITLVYQPSYNATNNKDTAKVQFELELLFWSGSDRQQKVVVRCFAVLYTSTMTVTPSNINFGDCHVGQCKRYTFSIENQSPLPGSVIVQFRSKIISIEGAVLRENTGREVNEEFFIAPSSSLPITLRITPQRVNPTYHKELFITNASNPKEERLVVTIDANNMPPSEAKLHNELYSWDPITPGMEKREENTLVALTNTPLLVPYLVQSKVDYPLNLSVRSTSAEVELFRFSDPTRAEQMETIEADFRFLVQGRNIAEDGNKVLEGNAERVEELRKELIKILRDGEVIQKICVEPLSSVKVYAIIIRTSFASEMITKEDGLMISIDSIEAPRFVRLSYKLCSTSFELLGQRTKNFGEVNIGTKKTTKLSLVNRCKSLLYVCLSKSRSVTAGHIRMGGSDKQTIWLTIRPFATKEIEVVFHPGIKGAFDEKIRIINLLDPKNTVSVTLKASVIKVDTFDISPDTWSFGPIAIPSSEDTTQNSRVGAKFTLSNTSGTKRQVRLQLDTMTSSPLAGENAPDKGKMSLFEGVDVNVQVEVELMGASSGSTRKIEEQIEKLQHKLKIYERKKKLEKAKVATARIEALKRALQGEEVDLSALENAAAPDTDVSESEDDAPNTGAATTKNRYQFDRLTVLATEGILLPVMNAGEAITITFGLLCRRNTEETLPAVQTNTINLLLFEAKDQEVNRIVPIDITVVRPEGETGTPSNNLVAHSRRSAPPPCLQLLPDDQAQGPTSFFMGSPLVVLRNSIVDDHTEFRFFVKSSLSTTVVVLEPRRLGCSTAYALEARFKFFPRNGLVKKDETLPIVVECTPRSVGPQKYAIPVKNLQNTAEIRYFVVELNPTEEEELLTAEPKQLVFPDIITPCDPSKVEPQLLLIRSRFNYPHYLNIRANKPSQIRLYEDINCTTPLTVPIQRNFVQGTVRVYVRYTPSPKSTNEDVHTISGGIILESVVPSTREGEYNITGRTAVRVTCRVGSGFLAVPTTSLDLGSVAPTEHVVHTHVKVINPSNTYTIRARLSPPSPSTVLLVGEDKLERLIMSLHPREERNVPVVMHLTAPGLVVAHLRLENLSCLQEPIRISLTALRLDESVSALFPPGSHGVVSLPVAPVTRDDEGQILLHMSRESSTTIRNSGSKDLIITSRCEDMPIVMCGTESPANERRPSSFVMEEVGGVKLTAHSNVKVYWRLVGVPPLTEEQIALLSDCHLVRLQTTVQVCVQEVVESRAMNVLRSLTRLHYPVKDQCLLVIPVTVSLAVSEGVAEPRQINFGTVAVGNRHRPKPEDATANPTTVQVLLRNLSEFLPLQLQVECQPVIRFSSTRVEIPPGGSLTVDASLQLKQIPTQGPFRYQAFFVNQLNAENDIAVTFTGQYYWKVFSLTYQDADVKDSTSLPPLRIESTSAPSILSEVRWNVSGTEQATELMLSVKHNSELEGMLELQLLNYDATSTLDRLTFQQGGEDAGKADGGAGNSGGTKPRAQQIQKIRLRCVLTDGTCLTKLANVFFGSRKLQVDNWTFDNMGENEKRLRSSTSNNMWLGTVAFLSALTDDEDIEIFGVLEPFNTFTVPSKLLVRPLRPNSLSFYSGDVTLTNICESYDCDLTVRVLFSDHLSLPLRVEVKTLAVRSPEHSTSNLKSPRSSTHEVTSTVFASVKSNKGHQHHHKQSAPEGGKSTVHNVRVPAKSNVALQVFITCLGDGDNNNTQIQQSLLEQYLALVVMDSNAPFCVNTLRVGVVPLIMDEDESSYESLRGSTSTGEMRAVDTSSNGNNSNSNCALEANPEHDRLTGSSGEALTNTPITLPTKGSQAEIGGAGDTLRELKIPDLAMPATPTRVLSLKNCTKVPGCQGAYTLALSFPKEEAPQPEIAIRNNLQDRPVEYQVSVVSQGPQPWLLLGSTSALLQAGETQCLRLNVLSVDAGSFVGYLAITNSANSGEVAYLRLSADVFLPSTGEGLFEVIDSSGQRVTSNTARLVPMGHLYGGGSTRAHVALEIVNRGNVALEFPVSVVNPFRQELKPLQQLNPLYAREVSLTSTDFMQTELPSSQGGYAFNGKLVVCHVYGVPTGSGQKYVVVDPKSRVRLVLLLTCDELRTPPGYGLSCEADVVFRCKQTRDSHFTFKAKFDLFPPSFEVVRDYYLIIKGEEPYCETRVVVRNILKAKQTFAFRSQSPIIYVIAGTGSEEEDKIQFDNMGETNVSGFFSFATAEIPAESEGYFLVRLDTTRAAALSGRDGGLQLNEHAHILNEGNPTERVRINFSASREDAGDGTVHPLKYGGQHISEHFVFRFSQKFTRVMTDNEERALSLFRLYESKRGTGSENLDSSPSSDDEENTNRSLGAGLDTTASSTPHMSERRSRALESEHSPGRVRPPDWKAFHQLLLDLIWIVDELVFYSILLCNSRRIEGYCSFVAATVVNHPVMQAWWKSKDVVPTAGEECVFARLVETLDTLPCATPSVS